MLYYAQGSAIVTSKELFESSTIDLLDDFFLGLSKGVKPKT